jgi:XRE family aerobic/anaerobic benzoate catabolism transcriptional regulator
MTSKSPAKRNAVKEVEDDDNIPEAGPLSPDSLKFLAEVGTRVRTARAKRGMTRKMLAQFSKTSERYLAQIETGRGNPTVLVLRAIAEGLGWEIEELIPASRPDDVSFKEAVGALRQISRTDLHTLTQHMRALATRTSDRAQRVALVGLRGAGKSTLGIRLADALGVPFVELNRLVEQSYGASVSLLIEMSGQATFREYERKCLESVIAEHRAVVIATAGGIVAERETYDRLLETSHTIWIEASPEEHMSRVIAQGDFRPMARQREAMSGLLAILDARRQDYARAEAHLNTSGHTVAESAQQLIALTHSILGR